MWSTATRFVQVGVFILVSCVIASTIESPPCKAVAEYPLPAAAQTHEILAVSDNLLLVTQQTDGSLVKVALNNNGEPSSSRKWTVTSPWSGLHGLALQSGTNSNTSAPSVWATAQFDNTIMQIDPSGENINTPPQVLRTIPIPSPAFGPHGILVSGQDIWIACKDSSHVVRISIDNLSDYQVWPVSGRPIFVAKHPVSGDVFASLDQSSKIWHYKNDGGKGVEIAVSPDAGTTPVGLVAGPDGDIWTVLVGNTTTGTGTFGRIDQNASVDWFSMSSSIGRTASLIHLAFDQSEDRFWLLGSSTVCSLCVDAIFTVKIDRSTGGTARPRIAVQNTIMLPTQRSWTHRVINHKGGLYITELTTSTLAYVRGAAVDGMNVSEVWDQYSFSGLGARGDAVVYTNLTVDY